MSENEQDDLRPIIESAERYIEALEGAIRRQRMRSLRTERYVGAALCGAIVAGIVWVVWLVIWGV